MSHIPRIAPGTFWEAVCAQTREALAVGALSPLVTQVTHIEDAGAQFQVHFMPTLMEGKQQSLVQGGVRNPFAQPWETALVVGGLSGTHGCLLNKYPVFKHHALLVTRSYEAQESWLSVADGEALRFCLEEGDNSLCFYNGGTAAGASQSHKHLQVVPLRASLESMIRAGALPVRHLVADTPQDGAALTARVARMLRQLGVLPGAPWNLLATRKWLLVVPRRTECFEGVSVNALGFSGNFLVKTQHQLQRLKAVGPLAVLRDVTLP